MFYYDNINLYGYISSTGSLRCVLGFILTYIIMKLLIDFVLIIIEVCFNIENVNKAKVLEGTRTNHSNSRTFR